MTFLLLHGSVVIGQTDSPAEALRHLSQPDNYLGETIVPGADPRTAIPGELDRAIDEWNARIVGKLKFAKQRIRARGQFVRPFRKWKRELGRRDYFLEQLIDDLLAATDFTQAYMRFGLFFKKKDGEYYSDLFRAGHYRDPNYKELVDAYGPGIVAAVTCECGHQAMAHKHFSGPCENCNCQQFKGA